MGAKVVACGRNEATLIKMEQILMISASDNEGNGGDAFVDFSPPAALRPFGKAAFMGGIWGDVKL